MNGLAFLVTDADNYFVSFDLSTYLEQGLWKYKGRVFFVFSDAWDYYAGRAFPVRA